VRHCPASWAATCAVVLVAAVAATPYIWHSAGPGSDLVRYAGYAHRTIRGEVPYRDFFIEYPPGSLAAILPPALVSTRPTGYGDAFAVEMLALLAAAIAATAVTLRALGVSTRQGVLLLTPLAGSTLLLGALPATRFDLLPACLTAAALAAVARRHELAGAAALGLGAAAKLFPAVAAPVLLVLAYRRGGARLCARAAAVFAGAFLAPLVPFAILAPHGLSTSLRYQLDRPLQFETLAGSAAVFLHAAAGFGVGLVPGNGTYNLSGDRGTVIGLAQTLLLAAVLAWLLWRSLATATTLSGLILCTTAGVCALVTLGRILSDQYLVWLLPLVPLACAVAGRLGIALLATFSVSEVLTRIWYFHLFTVQPALGPLTVLVARNVLLLATLGLLLVAVGRLPATPPSTTAPTARR
jgi:hypothetical protein